MRHTGGGLRLVALAVLAVGCSAVPALAKHDPPPGSDASSLPPGQAKKQQAAQQQAAPATTASATTTRQPQTTTATTPQPDATAAKHSSGKGNNGMPPGQAKKVAAATPPAAAATPPAARAPTTPTKAAKRAARRRKAAARRSAARAPQAVAVRPAITPIATAVTTSRPTPSRPKPKTTAAKTGSGGFVPAPAPKKTNDTPNVVFRTVRDAVDVVPAAIWILLGILTTLASLFAVTSARQTRRARLLAAERGSLLGDVGVLQEAVLPVVPPRVGALAVSVAHRPAGGPAAGGDFYDVIPLEHGRTALVVGDVTGHGAGALSQATLVRFTLRAHLESGAGPREALAIATESLAPHFEEGFATAAVAIHDPTEGTLTYATAAHEAPIVVGPGEHSPVLVSSTPPLGIGAGPSARRQTIVPFPAQSLACMLTDGALEARVRGELVGRARVEEWVRELGARPAAGDMAELIRSRAKVSDDLAVCFATATAGDDSGNWRVEELYRPTAQEAERFLEACGAAEDLRRKAAEALRFTREGTVLTVRFEGGAVVAAEVQRNGSPTPVAA